MNWLPAMQVAVKKLVLPGDISARQREPRVVELAESIRERTGKRPIHLPTVEYPSMKLLAGRDRIAACLLNGDRKVWVQPVSQLTDVERRDIERDENIHRRVDNRDELIRQRVLERELEIEAKRAEGGEPEERKPGRPKTAKGEARELVAREMGTTPDAIRVAEDRAEEEEIANKYSLTPLPCPVETYGLPLVSDVEAELLRTVQAAMEQADGLLRRAQGALSPIADLMPRLRLHDLAQAIHKVAFDVRQAIPTAVCPFCKRLEHFTPGCQGCGTSGFVGADALGSVADELKLGGDQAVVVALGGRMVPYAFAKTGKGAPKVAKAAKKIRIENEAGEELIPVDEDLPF